MTVLAALAAGVMACLLTTVIARYAEHHRLIDRPNERSSHAHPTPRGGGLAIVLVFLTATATAHVLGLLGHDLAAALYVACTVVAPVGFLDDRFSLPTRWRLVTHLLASAACVYLVGGWVTFQLGPLTLQLGPLGYLLWVLGLTWLLNLYNFMDGIDGLAASETVFACFAMAWLGWTTAADGGLSLLLLGSAAAGFLVLNWPPARIFMGDVGSSFLGFVLGVVALDGVSRGIPIAAWLIVLGVFVVDATLTLLRRALGGQRVTEAHRTHAYQYAARKFGAHRTVTVAVILVDVFWLLPLAWGAMHWPDWSPALLAVAYLPLMATALWLEAGKPEPVSN